MDLLHTHRYHHQGTHPRHHPHPSKGTLHHHNCHLVTLIRHPKVKGIKGISVEEGTLNLHLRLSSITRLSIVITTNAMIRIVVPLFYAAGMCDFIYIDHHVSMFVFRIGLQKNCRQSFGLIFWTGYVSRLELILNPLLFSGLDWSRCNKTMRFYYSNRNLVPYFHLTETKYCFFK